MRKLVAISTFFRRDGGSDWFWEGIKGSRLENMPTQLQEEYLRVAPHPENFRLFHDKAAQRMRDFEDIPDSAIRAINAPALVLAGDADVVRPEHAVALARLFLHSRLAILPGTDHMQMMTRTDWLASMVADFLDAEAPN